METVAAQNRTGRMPVAYVSFGETRQKSSKPMSMSCILLFSHCTNVNANADGVRRDGSVHG